MRARVRRTLVQTPWDALLARVAARGGRPDAATALQAFSLAVAPLPGVRVPKGPRGSIPEGTLATSWVLANYGRLTPGARQAVDRVLRRAFGLSGGAAAAGAQLDAVKAQAIAFVGQRAGVELTLPVTIVRGYPSSARGAAALGVDASGSYRSTKPAARCIISVRRGGASKTVIAHEVFHCLQIQLTGSASGLQSLDGDRAWLGEGSASYAGCLFSQDGAAPYRKAYAGYLEQPLTPLGGRTYDAVGFFAHLDQGGAGALGTRAARRSPRPSMAARLPGRSPTRAERTSSALGRRASTEPRRRGAEWDVSGPCAPPRSHAAEPTPIVLAGSGAVTLNAPAYAAHPYELFTGHTTAKAITVHPVSGHVRVGAAASTPSPPTDTVYCLGGGSARPTPPSRSAAVTGARRSLSPQHRRSTACGPGGGRDLSDAALPAVRGNSSTARWPRGSRHRSSPSGRTSTASRRRTPSPGPPAIWDIPVVAPTADDIQGFTTDISYNVGQTVQFKIDTPATQLPDRHLPDGLLPGQRRAVSRPSSHARRPDPAARA